jgi:hypothetical protein
MNGGRTMVLEQWLSKNRKHMIQCPYQPGQLRISKSACQKRHLAAHQMQNVGGDFLHYNFRQGLLACRDCPIVRKITFS